MKDIADDVFRQLTNYQEGLRALAEGLAPILPAVLVSLAGFVMIYLAYAVIFKQEDKEGKK